MSLKKVYALIFLLLLIISVVLYRYSVNKTPFSSSSETETILVNFSSSNEKITHYVLNNARDKIILTTCKNVIGPNCNLKAYLIDLSGNILNTFATELKFSARVVTDVNNNFYLVSTTDVVDYVFTEDNFEPKSISKQFNEIQISQADKFLTINGYPVNYVYLDSKGEYTGELEQGLVYEYICLKGSFPSGGCGKSTSSITWGEDTFYFNRNLRFSDNGKIITADNKLVVLYPSSTGQDTLYIIVVVE